MEVRNVGEWAAMAEESRILIITVNFNIASINLFCDSLIDSNILKRTQPKNVNVV